MANWANQSHTILGSKTQRGLTQLSLDLLFRSLQGKTIHPSENASLVPSLIATDASEAQILPASSFLEGVYGDSVLPQSSRAATPMTVGDKYFLTSYDASAKKARRGGLWSQWDVLGLMTGSEARESEALQDNARIRCVKREKAQDMPFRVLTHDAGKDVPSKLPFWGSPHITRTKAKLRFGNVLQDTSFMPPPTPRRHAAQRPSALPSLPDISNTTVASSDMDYAIVISMYEVYNDRIFDLLTRNSKDGKRRALLFKSTEGSPDRKVVAGLRKIVCGSYEEALMVLEAGLLERRVAGTGSNSVSSRSHGFFCVEVKKRSKGRSSSRWKGAQLTIVDLAGSERARNAKTAGATLAEAGKINESLMYLGQCLQMQSDYADSAKVSGATNTCIMRLIVRSAFHCAF